MEEKKRRKKGNEKERQIDYCGEVSLGDLSLEYMYFPLSPSFLTPFLILVFLLVLGLSCACRFCPVDSLESKQGALFKTTGWGEGGSSGKTNRCKRFRPLLRSLEAWERALVLRRKLLSKENFP
jgi:hypothetical protein